VKKVKVNVRIVVAVTMLALALSGAALAQSYDQSVRATIPFSFYANGALQPAGTYDFAINLGTNRVAMSSDESGTASFLGGVPEDGAGNGVASLTFRLNAEGTYVLEKAQWPDVGVGFNAKAKRSASLRASNETRTVIAQVR
jgi:hypothetical protein